MQQYFSLNYEGSAFVLFGYAHLGILLLIAFICFFLLRYGNRIPKHLSPTLRYSLVSIYVVNEAFRHLWFLWYDKWDITYMLPLDLCSIGGLIGVLMLIRPRQLGYEWLYFLGIAGALQAALTPVLTTYGFPHALFFQFFIAHGFIFIAALYLTAVEGFRPYGNSLLHVFIMGNLYTLFVGGVNFVLGSNYLFIAHKPITPSALDLLPAWPWYILFMELVAIISVCLLYLPYLWRDRGFVFKPSTEKG